MLNFLTSSLLTFLPKPPILASCLFLEQTNFQPQAFGGSFQFPCGSAGKEFACNAGDLGLIPGLGDPLEKEMASCSSILAWGIPWTEEPGGLQSVGLQTVRHDWAPAPPESLGKGRSASFRKTRGGREGLQLKKCARVGLAGSSPICTHGNLQLVHRKQTRRKPESSNLETKVNSAGQLCFQRKEGSCLSKI